MRISPTSAPRQYVIGLLVVSITLLFLFSGLGPVQSATQRSKRTFEIKIKKDKEDKALDTENRRLYRKSRVSHGGSSGVSPPVSVEQRLQPHKSNVTASAGTGTRSTMCANPIPHLRAILSRQSARAASGVSNGAIV